MIRFVTIALAAALVAGCEQADPETLTQSHGLGKTVTPIEGLERFALGEPIAHENVIIVPVLSVPQGDDAPESTRPDYITLAEAKKNEWVEIFEVPGAETVSTLRVRNTGPRPLLLLAGDLLLGGKQDRVVAKDTVVQPGETLEVAVYCVEQGRWTDSDGRFSYSETSVPQSVKDALIEQDQGLVWDSVASANRRSGASAGRTTVQAGIESKAVQDRMKSGLQPLTDGLSAYDNVVGLVFVLNGRVRSLELFGSPELLVAAREGILKGFLAESAAYRSESTGQFSLESAQDFLRKAIASERTELSRSYGTTNTRVDGEVRGMEAMSAPQSTPGSAASSPEFIRGTYKSIDE